MFQSVAASKGPRRLKPEKQNYEIRTNFGADSFLPETDSYPV
jgi:hypothetical protein